MEKKGITEHDKTLQHVTYGYFRLLVLFIHENKFCHA